MDVYTDNIICHEILFRNKIAEEQFFIQKIFNLKNIDWRKNHFEVSCKTNKNEEPLFVSNQYKNDECSRKSDFD